MTGARCEGAKSSARPIEADAKSCALWRGDTSPDGEASIEKSALIDGSIVSREGDSSSRREYSDDRLALLKRDLVLPCRGCRWPPPAYVLPLSGGLERSCKGIEGGPLYLGGESLFAMA